MAIGQQNRTTAVSILQIGFSRNTECADMTGFPWPSHIYPKFLIVELHFFKSNCMMAWEMNQQS